MSSKKCSDLYFAGEILDIDGVTGGFNFQSAWTTAWLAGKAIGARHEI
jgi:predicted flavoprotein YhiN